MMYSGSPASNSTGATGSAPVKAAARGETGLGIVFMHDAIGQTVEGFPIKVVAPCEGTGYETGSVSIIKGGKNPEDVIKTAESKYPLTDAVLTADFPLGVSNHFIGQAVRVAVRRGCLGARAVAQILDADAA